MVSAPGPASSARPIAAATISARPRGRCRGGGGGWVQMSGAGPIIGLRTTGVYYINSEFMSETFSFEPEGIRLGVVRGISFGLFGPPGEFVPQARALGAGLVRAYLFWSQVEPEPGHYRWDTVDAHGYVKPVVVGEHAGPQPRSEERRVGKERRS